MLRRARFGNCDDITIADGPGQRDSGCRAIMCRTDTCERGIAQQASARAAERGIGHHRYAVPLAPWQQVMLDAAITEVVEDLIGRTPIAMRNTEKIFHVTELEVGHAPGADLPRRAQTLERRHNAGEIGVSTWPVQQVEIEMISAETG